MQRPAIEDLIAAGVVRNGMPYASPKVSSLREKYVNGSTTREWVTEYQFTMSFAKDGLVFPDIGLTVGVHRKGVISSIHATDATIVDTGSVTTTLTLAQAESALQSALATSFPSATYINTVKRQGALLNPTASTEVIDPGGIFNYTLAFTGGRSRQRISRVSLVSGTVQHLYF